MLEIVAKEEEQTLEDFLRGARKALEVVPTALLATDDEAAEPAREALLERANAALRTHTRKSAHAFVVLFLRKRRRRTLGEKKKNGRKLVLEEKNSLSLSLSLSLPLSLSVSLSARDVCRACVADVRRA